jgi:hypothetical protein
MEGYIETEKKGITHPYFTSIYVEAYYGTQMYSQLHFRRFSVQVFSSSKLSPIVLYVYTQEIDYIFQTFTFS